MGKLCDPTVKKTVKYVIQVFFIGSWDDEKAYDDERLARDYLREPKGTLRPRRLIRRTEELLAEKSTKEYYENR